MAAVDAAHGQHDGWRAQVHLGTRGLVDGQRAADPPIGCSSCVTRWRCSSVSLPPLPAARSCSIRRSVMQREVPHSRW